MNPYAETVPRLVIYTKKILNPDSNIFIPINLKLSGICAYLAFCFIITIFILCDLNKTIRMSIGKSTPKYDIKRLKLSNPNKIILGHLNINSVRSKFECLRDIINNNIDILLISETKLDVTFPVGQFLINGFHSPVRKDRNDKGGGLLLYIQEHIPFREIMIHPTPNIEIIFVEINLRKRKWLLICSYNPGKK